MILTRSSPRDCQLTFLSVCELTFLSAEASPSSKFWKKWKWPYRLNCEEYCDEILHTHWYCQDVANEIVRWHLGLVEVLPRFKFWKKKWNCPYYLNLLVYFDKILHTNYYWHVLDRGIAKSSPRDCKMTFNIGRSCAELQILKKWKWLLWWNFANTLILTRCSPRDCQMSFGIGRGVAEVQILINSETGPISGNFLNILIKLCINIAIDVSWTEGLPNVIYHQQRLCRGPNLKNKWIWPAQLLDHFNMYLSKFWKKSKT